MNEAATPAPVNPTPVQDRSSIILGFLTTVALDIVFGIVTLLIAFSGKTMEAMFWIIASFPLTQFLWLAPLAVLKHKKGAKRFSKGMLIAAALVLLVSGACWGIGLLKK